MSEFREIRGFIFELPNSQSQEPTSVQPRFGSEKIRLGQRVKLNTAGAAKIGLSQGIDGTVIGIELPHNEKGIADKIIRVWLDIQSHASQAFWMNFFDLTI